MICYLKLGGSGWESNPPRPATRPATGFEDQETHRGLTTPEGKDNRMTKGLQAKQKTRQAVRACQVCFIRLENISGK